MSRKWVRVAVDPEPAEEATRAPEPAESFAASMTPHAKPDDDKKSEKEKNKGPPSRVAIQDEDLLESGILFSPIKMTMSEKALLRDNMTSVLRKDIQPKFLRVNHQKLKVGSYLRAAIRLVYKDHAYKVKRISFDRPVMHHGLLYFIDGLERDQTQTFHIWLYICLVHVRPDGNHMEIPREYKHVNKKTGKEEIRQLITVHDWGCKKCKTRKECNHKYKAVEQLTEYTFGVHIKFNYRLKEPVYLYCITLNSPKQAALSSRLLVGTSDKKEKEKKEKGKKKEKKSRNSESSSSTGTYTHDQSSIGGDSDTDSFAEPVTEPMTENSFDMDDDESFFEKSYSSFGPGGGESGSDLSYDSPGPARAQPSPIPGGKPARSPRAKRTTSGVASGSASTYQPSRRTTSGGPSPRAGRNGRGPPGPAVGESPMSILDVLRAGAK